MIKWANGTRKNNRKSTGGKFMLETWQRICWGKEFLVGWWTRNWRSEWTPPKMDNCARLVSYCRCWARACLSTQFASSLEFITQSICSLRASRKKNANREREMERKEIELRLKNLAYKRQTAASPPKHETRMFLHTLNFNFSLRRLEKQNISENERRKLESR